ncbi:MAG: DUF4384 domain-containing protein [Candidatus Scalinduaceae bacterium]
MRKLSFLIISFVAVYLLAGCVTEKYVDRPPRVPRPEWVNKVPDEDEKYHYFVGRKTHALTYESGWDDAFQNAVSKISRMIQSKVTVDYDKQRYERGIAHDTEISDAGSYIRDRVRILSSEIARGVKEVAAYSEDLLVEKAIRYNVYVLVRYPKDEYKRIKNNILGIKPEIDKGHILLVSGKCKEAIDYFYTLTIKDPKNEKAQYYLSLAYDECGDKAEALRAYKVFLDMHPDAKVLREKSVNRIRELRNGLIDKLIEEAVELADRHEFQKCLERLEEAYSLNPSPEIANKIIERYSKYSISLIAWAMTSCSYSLKEKTVSVVPFSDLRGEENTQGKAVATELISELVNLQRLKVYERNSIPDILKEIEMGGTGAIDERTRKELGKMVNTESVVVGWVGYIENTFKINARMIHVETGRIIVSENVKMLGWNVDDTDKNTDFNINVWTNSKVYRIGEPTTIYLTSDRDCYVTLLNVRSNGEIWELFPNRYNRNNFIRANVRYSIPSTNDDFKLSIVEPPGKEYIKVIATSVPLSIEQIRRVLSKDTSFLVASADMIRSGDDSVFRAVSPVEMRGLHEIMTRGIGIVPKTENEMEYKEVDYYESGSQFVYAVSSWPFETRK